MKRKKKIFFGKITAILLAGFSIFGETHAQELSGIPASFVDLGFGARAAGMGNAFVAAANDANAVFWNPAGIIAAKNASFEFNYLNQMQLVPYSSLGGVIPLSRNKDGIGVGLIYSGDDALKEFTFIVAYARRFGKFNVGANLKYRYASFGNNGFDENDYSVFDADEITAGELTQVFGNGNGFGMDVGVIYEFSETVNIGVSLKDVFAPFNWSSDTKSETQKPKGDYNEPMPLQAYFGVSVHPFEPLYVNADYKPAFQNDASNTFYFGAEYIFMNILSFRAGTQQAINSVDDEKYNFGVGVRYSFGGITASANYAYVIEELGNTSRFSLGISL